MSSEFSNNLPPSAKPYYFSYLQGFDWYKAQLLSLTGPIADALPDKSQQQGQGQSQTQSSQNAQQPATAQQTNDAPHITSYINKAGRIRIDGEITDVNQKAKTFSIRTDIGTLALKLATTATLPPEGLRIELDIPRAKEGQQISFRPLPHEAQSAVIKQQIITAEGKQTTAPPLEPQTQPNQTIPPLRANPPLIDTEIAQTTQGTTNAAPVAPSLPTLQTGAIIAVTPLPASALAAIIALPLQASTTTAQVTPQTNANVIPQTAPQSTAVPETINIAPPNAAPLGQTDGAPLPQKSSTTTPQNIAPSKESAVAPTLPQATQSTAPSVPPTIQSELKAPLPAQNLGGTIKTPAAAIPTESAAPIAPKAPPQNMAAIKIEEIIPQIAQQNTRPLDTAKPVSSSNIKPDQPAPQIAEFIGRTADNKPVIAVQNASPPSQEKSTATALALTSRSLFVLNTSTDAPQITQGTKILFTPAPEQTHVAQPTSMPTSRAEPQIITAAAATIPPYAFPLTSASDTWPALDEITQSLQQSAPSAAQNLLQQSPNINNSAFKMEPAILFFLVAARSGDIAGWLGDKATEMLRATGKGDSISRMLRNFTGLSHSSREAGSPTVTPEWRSVPIPMFAYNEAHKVMLHYKYDDETNGDENRNRKNSMRFLIDLDLNKMGDVQLDGFAQAERLDLIVRTQKPLSPTMQQIMRRKYSSSLEVTGFRGELSFHGTQDKFVKLEAVTEQSGFSI